MACVALPASPNQYPATTATSAAPAKAEVPPQAAAPLAAPLVAADPSQYPLAAAPSIVSSTSEAFRTHITRAKEETSKMAMSEVNEISHERSNDPSLKDFCVDLAEGSLVDAGRSIYTNNVRSGFVLVARCYREGALKACGILHYDGTEGTSEAFLKAIKDKNFTEVQFKIIGGYKDIDNLRDLKADLKEFGFLTPPEVVRNPYDVRENYTAKYEAACELVGTSLRVGITREGYIYYSYESYQNSFKPKVIKRLHSFLTGQNSEIQALAEKCKKDPKLKAFWIALITHVASKVLQVERAGGAGGGGAGGAGGGRLAERLVSSRDLFFKLLEDNESSSKRKIEKEEG